MVVRLEGHRSVGLTIEVQSTQIDAEIDQKGTTKVEIIWKNPVND